MNLIIVGAGVYAVVAYEIARDMGCYEKIGFIDDNRTVTPNGIEVQGRLCDIKKISQEYTHAIVAIGNAEFRLATIEMIEKETSLEMTSLISPRAYVSESAHIMNGCIIEPMAVVHAGCVICNGTFICAGAVVNHASVCRSGVQVDCNATIAGYTEVPEKVKVSIGAVYKNNEIDPKNLTF